ncbi:CD1871A family CXXC motif-containing protein [Lachnospiraceae bacterium 29-84]
MRRRLQESRGGICVAVLGLALMGYGIFRGEMPIVFAKAINICMECIGIG